MQEQEAISRCQAGEQEALGVLYQLHNKAVCRTAYGITRNYDLAEDITQQVFIELITAIQRYDARRPFPPWLHRIAVHKSLDELRKSKRTTNRYVPVDDHIPASSDPSPEQTVIDKELRAAIWVEVGKLSPRHRAVVVLYHYHGFSVAEISQSLGCLRATVRTRLYNARKHLRDTLREPPTDQDQDQDQNQDQDQDQNQDQEQELANVTQKLPLGQTAQGWPTRSSPIRETAGRTAGSYIPVCVEVDPC